MKISSKTNRSMASLIKKQAAGTQTVTEFCRMHRIKLSKFFYWKKKMKERGKSPTGDSQSPNGSAGSFIPISLPAVHSTELADKIELHFPSGLRACIPVSTGTAALRTIINACGR
jgi:hypothetical protein